MGAITFDYISPKFAMPRPYLSHLAIRGDFSVAPTLVGNVISFVAAAGYIYSLAIKPEVFVWSNNAYTLDHIFDEAASSIDCVLFPCHDTVDVIFKVYINDEKPCVGLHPLALGSTVVMIDLPPPPDDYWLPNP